MHLLLERHINIDDVNTVRNITLTSVIIHGYLEQLDMNEKYVVYQSGPIFSCDAADQLKNHCSTKPINLRFGAYVYDSSGHPLEKIRNVTWNNGVIIRHFVENESV